MRKTSIHQAFMPTQAGHSRQIPRKPMNGAVLTTLDAAAVTAPVLHMTLCLTHGNEAAGIRRLPVLFWNMLRAIEYCEGTAAAGQRCKDGW